MLRIRLAVIAAMAAGLVTASGADPAKTGDSQRIVSHIPREPVHSTAIAKVGYSKRRRILEIEFVNGAIYRYLNVPASVYRDLRREYQRDLSIIACSAAAKGTS